MTTPSPITGDDEDRTDQPPMKIAVAGATGRVGRHIVDVLNARGHHVVPISRSHGVDVITRDGLAAALAGVECVIDAATGPSPDQDAATEFFTTAARNLHDAGQRAGVQRMIVVSIIGTDRFTAGYGAAKLAHERAMLSGPIPVRVLRAAQFHEFVAAARGVGHAGRGELRAATCAPSSSRPGPSPRHSPTWPPSQDRPRHRSRRSPARVRSASSRWRRCSPLGAASREDRGRERPGRPRTATSNENGALLPGPGAVLAGPTFEEWLDSTP